MEPPTEALRAALGALALAEPPPSLRSRCSPADADAPCGFAALPDDVLFRLFAALSADARAACARVCAPWRNALLHGADEWRIWTRCSPADARKPCRFATLPVGVLRRVFAALPADARARCACVCAPWREALQRGADAWRSWTRLDLSAGSGVAWRDDETLLGAAALARGRLQELDLSKRAGKRRKPVCVSHDALLHVLRGNPELRALALDGLAECSGVHFERASRTYSIVELQLETGAGTSVVARTWLRNDTYKRTSTWVNVAALHDLAGAVLARACRVETLTLSGGGLRRWYLPALARLLAGRDGAALAHVTVCGREHLFGRASPAHMEAVCAALRRSRLATVKLVGTKISEDRKAALRNAAAANPRLRLFL